MGVDGRACMLGVAPSGRRFYELRHTVGHAHLNRPRSQLLSDLTLNPRPAANPIPTALV